MANSSAVILVCSCLALAGMALPAAGVTASPASRGVAEQASRSGGGGDPSRLAAPLCYKASVQYELGRTSENGRTKATHLRRAEEYAQQAIRIDPRGGEGYKWLAIALGAQAEDASVRQQIQLSRRVKENIEKALSLDPNDDISLLILSRWHYKVAQLAPWTRAVVRVVYGGLPQASMEKAEQLLLRAISRKDRIVHRYSLAKVYYQTGRREAALQQLRLALKLPVTIPEEKDDLQKARKKLVSW